ncbi:MAG TPA: ABC transporter permease [Jatrophihabitans sp.]|jgi:spermidine/putrescine transport system permease protein|uniref:ABC transporter permease n=1 Tax=Jatrophihabitans sp. TaxID=1932789 RepID=UPI002F009EB3
MTSGAQSRGVQAVAEPDAVRPRRRVAGMPYFLLLPGLLWLAVFFVIPMIFLLSQSLQTGTLETGYQLTFHFATYTDSLQQFSRQFLRSFQYAFLATVLALLIGYPLAYAIALKSGRFKSVLLVMVIAPFFTSFLLRTLAWQTILNSDGLVMKFFRGTHLIELTSALGWTNGSQLLSSPLAVVTGLTYNFLPFMILPLFASLDRLDPRLLEAAGDLYATPFTAFRRVTLPMSMPGVVAGTLLTFIPAAGDYINSRLLGNPNTAMIGQVIEGYFLRINDYPTAAALSFALMLTILVLVSVYIRKSGTEELV